MFQSFNAGTVPQIFIPLNLSPRFRLEPGIGYFKSTIDMDYYEISSKGFSFGLGIFPMSRKGDVIIYNGVRLGITRTTSKEKFEGSDSEEDSEEGFFIAPTVGGEYVINERFTLGGEAQIRYASYKQYRGEYSEWTTTSVITRSLLFIRFYFY